MLTMKQQHRNSMNVRLLGDIELGSVGESGDTPQFSIDRSLFEIDYADLELKREIGTGGSGALVFHADWNGQSVAVKLFRTSSFAGQTDFSEFGHEISLLGSLRHPNIVLFFGAVLASPRVGAGG